MVLRVIGNVVTYTIIAGIIITFSPGLPPYHVQYEEYPITPAMSREGKFPLNNLLDKAEVIISHGQDGNLEAIGPESIAVSPDEIVYTGVENGDILQYHNGKISILSPAPNTCEPWTQPVCGRPAGLRYVNNQLFVADAYHGLFKVDMDTGKREYLFPIDQPIEGKLALIVDDLDVAKDGAIYWSDASTNGDFMDAAHEFLGGASGRLVRFDPKTKRNLVLIDGIHFANGVQLSKKEDFVLVAELVRARILRYYLSGPKLGEVDIFLDGLPGLPDNIRSNGKGGFLISLISPREILENLRPFPGIRKLIGRVRQLLLYTLMPFEYLLPGNPWLGLIRLRISHLGTIPHAPAQIVEVSGDGEILRFYDSQAPHVSLISQMSVSKEYAYLGSPIAHNLLRIKLSDLQ